MDLMLNTQMLIECLLLRARQGCNPRRDICFPLLTQTGEMREEFRTLPSLTEATHLVLSGISLM